MPPPLLVRNGARLILLPPEKNGVVIVVVNFERGAKLPCVAIASVVVVDFVVVAATCVLPDANARNARLRCCEPPLQRRITIAATAVVVGILAKVFVDRCRCRCCCCCSAVVVLLVVPERSDADDGDDDEQLQQHSKNKQKNDNNEEEETILPPLRRRRNGMAMINTASPRDGVK